MTPESTLLQANELLRTGGVAEALEFLGSSPHAASESIAARMHELLWAHRKTLPESLLSERFLDPLWCRCTVCAHEWVISPVLMQAEMPVAAAGGVTCTSCDRVLCAPCFRTAGPRCPNGHPYTGIRRPNGRRPRQPLDVNAEDAFDRGSLPETPVPDTPDLHLAFGFSGRVPVGIDTSFPRLRTSMPSDHLAWAEALADAGLHYHAELQLDLAGPLSDSERGPALWLRARLLVARLRNAEERYRRHEVVSLQRPKWQRWPSDIRKMLDEAVQLAPDRGDIALTAAEFHLEEGKSERMARALECAQQARAQLGDTPRVRRAYGRALRACDRPREAMEFLEGAELREAELEARCHSEPFDRDAHWQLGWIYQRSLRFQDARRLFTRFRERFPDRAEGYCGLAMLELVDYDRPIEERYERSYAQCQEALARDASLGATFEVLGLIFDSVRTTRKPVTFPVGEPLESYRRALALDPTRDAALEAVAENEIDAGRLASALELLERAAALDTLIDGVYSRLAIIYRGTRQFEKEEKAWRRAKELAPGIGLTAEYAERILRLCGFEY